MSYDSPPQKLRWWKRARKIEDEEARVSELWSQMIMEVMDCETYAHMPPPTPEKVAEAKRKIVALAREWVFYPPENP